MLMIITVCHPSVCTWVVQLRLCGDGALRPRTAIAALHSAVCPFVSVRLNYLGKLKFGNLIYTGSVLATLP